MLRVPPKPKRRQSKQPTIKKRAPVARRRLADHKSIALARAEAQAAQTRLRDAIDILPQGVVFLDAEGRYILWNQQYAEIYKGSADLFQPGAKLEDTLRIGV